MILYVVHGNTYYDDEYGHEEHLFGVCTQKDGAEVIRGIAVKELYEKEMKKKVRRSTVKDMSDIEVEILEIEADKFVNIELGEYIE